MSTFHGATSIRRCRMALTLIMRNMRRFSFTILFGLIVITCNAQKLCIWEPSEYKVPSISNYSDTLYISISDDRELPDNSKIKYSSEELVNYLYKIMEQAFPNATIIKNTNNTNKLGFSIHINFYSAFFKRKITAQDLIISPLFTGGSSRWFGMTEYNVECYDKRISPEKTNKTTFKGEDNSKNKNGYGTAKKMLTSSFKQATDSLIAYLVFATSV